MSRVLLIFISLFLLSRLFVHSFLLPLHVCSCFPRQQNRAPAHLMAFGWADTVSLARKLKGISHPEASSPSFDHLYVFCLNMPSGLVAWSEWNMRVIWISVQPPVRIWEVSSSASRMGREGVRERERVIYASVIILAYRQVQTSTSWSPWK